MKSKIAMQTLLRFAREERGATLVEFAMTALLLVALLAAVLQWSLAMYAYHFTSYAAQEGARFAAVRGYTWSKSTTTNCSTSAPPGFTMPYECTASASDIQNYVQSLATSGINASNVTINTTSSYVWPGTTPDCTSSCSTCSSNANSQGCLVKVTVNYTFNLLPLLKSSAFSMSATSEDAILQ
jgi:Flp pilus assembly protein TadG